MHLIRGELAEDSLPDQPMSAPAAGRLAIIDSDSGFTQVLAK
jgi:hypothetical protein